MMNFSTREMKEEFEATFDDIWQKIEEVDSSMKIPEFKGILKNHR
jgi:hypothetical protein